MSSDTQHSATDAATDGYPSYWRSERNYDPNQDMLQLKGRDYLTVQSRLVWFIRDQRTLIMAGLGVVPFVVRTELIEIDRERGWAHFKTYVRDVLGNEATMYGSEAAKDFPDFAEKASTKSLGRALLSLGYGTAAAQEMDEGDRVVDTPVERRARPEQQAAQRSPTPLRQPQQPPATRATVSEDPAAAIVAPALQAELKVKICEAYNLTSAEALQKWLNEHVRAVDAPRGPIDALALKNGNSNINGAELLVARELVATKRKGA